MFPALLLMGAAVVPPTITIAPPTIRTAPKVEFEMGQRHYLVATPYGYCRPDPKSLGVLLDDVADPQGQVLAKSLYLAKCNRSGFENDVEVLIFKYFRNVLAKTADRAEFIKLYEPLINGQQYIKSLGSEEMRQAASKEAEREGGGQDVQLDSEGVSLGSDDACIYHGVRMTLSEPEQKPVKMMMATCTTVLDGYMLMIDMSAKVDRGLTFADLTKNLNTMVNSISKKQT